MPDEKGSIDGKPEVDDDAGAAFEEDFDDDPIEDDDPDDDSIDDDVDEIEIDDNPPARPAERTAARPAEQAAEQAGVAAGDDTDDEVDPDNLEDDLNTILRDRIAAGDDTDDDDEAGAESAGQPAELLGTVTPRRGDEWLCEGCFLLVSRSQLGSRSDPRCPSGEEVCPSLDRLGP